MRISALLCETYDRLFAGGEVQFPLYDKQRAAIDTIVKTVNASYFGIVRFHTLQWFEVYCQVQGLRPRKDIALDQLAISIEKSGATMKEVLDFAYQILF
jgi:hypothetical protein